MSDILSATVILAAFLLAAGSLPVYIYADSRRRSGKPSWGWIASCCFLFLAAASYSGRQPRPPDYPRPLALADVFGSIAGVYTATFFAYLYSRPKNRRIVLDQASKSAWPSPRSIEPSQPAIGPPEAKSEENEPEVAPCPACGGRGRIERRRSRQGFFARLVGPEHSVEKCFQCNGTGAAEREQEHSHGGLTGR